MTPQRAYQLETTSTEHLTKLELEQGYHFCADWDYMLVSPDTPEWEYCTCTFKREYEKTK